MTKWYWTEGGLFFHSIPRCPLKRVAPKEERFEGQEFPGELSACPMCVGVIKPAKTAPVVQAPAVQQPDPAHRRAQLREAVRRSA